MEYWKQIEGYPHLLVSRTGQVWTTTYNRLLKPHISNRGYLRIGLNKDKVVKSVGVHRLVAQAFIPNPDNLPAVDHIDGNKLNNTVENLQWISHSDNIQKACKGHNRMSKPVICIETGKVYKTIKEANRELHIPEAVLSSVVRGEFPAYHGLHFAYYKEQENTIPKGYLTTGEYARKHNVSASTVKQRVSHGNIPYIRFNGSGVTLNLIKEDEPWVILKRGRKAKR